MHFLSMNLIPFLLCLQISVENAAAVIAVSVAYLQYMKSIFVNLNLVLSQIIRVINIMRL